jgi:hypothetical protein
VHGQLFVEDLCFISTMANLEPQNMCIFDGTSIELCSIPVCRFPANMPPRRIIAGRNNEKRLQCTLAFARDVLKPSGPLLREECCHVADGREASLASCLAKSSSTSCCATLPRAECNY